MHLLNSHAMFLYPYHFVSTRLGFSRFLFCIGPAIGSSQIDEFLFLYTLESRLGLGLGGRGDPKKEKDTARLVRDYSLNHLGCCLILACFA
ncbi:unnamed protein product [Urochloa humidicola]